MKTKLVKILSIVIIILCIPITIFFYSIYYTVDHVQIKKHTLTNEQIPASMDNLKIAFFSDIKYGAFMTKDRLTPMFEQLMKYDTDIIIFGGDLFTYFHDQNPTKEEVQELTELFSNLEAPLGKFAVLGDEDVKDKEASKLVKKILFDADFEVIQNQPLQIRNGGNDGISLIGIDPLINGKPNIEKAMKSINQNEYTIMVTHCPDLLTSSDMKSEYLDVVLSGHSLGGQINFPLIGSLRRIDGARTYTSGNYKIDNTILHVSDGLGTVDMDMRLFARPEIDILQLKHAS